MEYTPEIISNIVAQQRTYFRKGETLDVSFRIQQLKQAVIDSEEMLEAALHEDLGRSKAEAYLCDVGPVILEINETINGLMALHSS